MCTAENRLWQLQLLVFLETQHFTYLVMNYYLIGGEGIIRKNLSRDIRRPGTLCTCNGKGKVTPLQARCGPEGE